MSGSESGSKGERKAKGVLDRIVAMLTKLGRCGYAVGEECAEYATADDSDTDSDPDADGTSGRGPDNKSIVQSR